MLVWYLQPKYLHLPQQITEIGLKIMKNILQGLLHVYLYILLVYWVWALQVHTGKVFWEAIILILPTFLDYRMHTLIGRSILMATPLRVQATIHFHVVLFDNIEAQKMNFE